jgi:transposase
MNYIIGCDAHKRYSQFAVCEKQSQKFKQVRVEHEPGAIRNFLTEFPEGTSVALESIGNWHWIVDEIEEAGCQPLMAHAAKAKVMMGKVNKTDKLDAQGLAILLRNGTQPTVWIAPGKTRDERELPRTRMALCKIRVALKNRIHATLAKYNLSLETDSDIFAEKWCEELKGVIQELPAETQNCVRQEVELLELLQGHIQSMEERMHERIPTTPTMQLLKTLPGVGDILSIVIACEIGSIKRFASAEQLASYAGTVPTVKSSGGKTRYGHLPPQSNHYLKWAFVEAANGVARHHRHPNWQPRHVTQLYERVRRRKGHAVAVGAVARHLAEATYWMLTRNQSYQEPASRKVLLRQEGARSITVSIRDTCADCDTLVEHILAAWTAYRCIPARLD